MGGEVGIGWEMAKILFWVQKALGPAERAYKGCLTGIKVYFMQAQCLTHDFTIAESNKNWIFWKSKLISQPW